MKLAESFSTFFENQSPSGMSVLLLLRTLIFAASFDSPFNALEIISTCWSTQIKFLVDALFNPTHSSLQIETQQKQTETPAARSFQKQSMIKANTSISN